ncbi:MAG: hemolysin family protein [Acidobacteriota bacterium]
MDLQLLRDLLTQLAALASWGIALGALGSVVLSVLSALLERSGPIRLRHWAEEAGGRLRAMYFVPARFAAFRLWLSVLARILPLLLLGLLLVGAPSLGVATSMALVLLLLLAIEWGNRLLVERHSERALQRATPLLMLLGLLLRPLVLLTAWAVPALTDDADAEEEEEDVATENELNAFIDVGRREGILEAEDGALVRSILDFGDTQVKSVMTPRVEIVAAPADADVEMLAGLFLESKHARLPLYRDSIDQVVGILHIRDLFAAMRAGATDAASFAERVNPPIFIPETKRLPDLLQQMQSQRLQMAIVVDEYGGVSGLVTVEDLVEEIVGEISDEHEQEDAPIAALDDGSWRLEGRTELEILAEHVGDDDLRGVLDETPYETVSGLICGELGAVPGVGDTFEYSSLIFRVEAVDERRVITALVHQVPALEGPGMEPAAATA